MIYLLTTVVGNGVHQPADIPEKQQKDSGCVIGQDYLYPIVDHSERRKWALEMYKHLYCSKLRILNENSHKTAGRGLDMLLKAWCMMQLLTKKQNTFRERLVSLYFFMIVSIICRSFKASSGLPFFLMTPSVSDL